MNIFIDIETIPSQRPDVLEEIILNIKPPATLKRPESIAKWEKESRKDAIDKEYRKTALNGDFGEIVCIGYAVEDSPVNVLYRDLTAPESGILKQFYDEIHALWSPRKREITWIGHNITGFDLRYIWKRSKLNGVKQSFRIPYDCKPWSSLVFDTMHEWAGLRDKVSQDRLCKIFCIPGKPNDIDGSKVWDFVKEGRIEEVANYCKDDVEKVRMLFNLMK